MPEATSPPPALAAALRRMAPNLEQVEQAMRAQLSSETALLGALGEYLLDSGGKRLRPALLFWAAELCGYTGPRRVQVAAAVELLHSATLLHDDVVDMAELRRGRPSARAIWGNRRAVLAGDFFYARASSMIVEDGDASILEIFAETIRQMAEGELMQLERSFDPAISEAHYFAVIERKSASLMAAACSVGARLGGVTRAEQRRLGAFGHEFGLAFQLRDDALDYSAGETQLGKAPFTDLREGKVTLPLLLTLKRATTAEREAIGRVLKTLAERAHALAAQDVSASEETDRTDAGHPVDRADADDPADRTDADGGLATVLELVRRHRGVADTNARASQHVARAASAIAPFPDSLVKDALLAVAAFAADRAS